MNGWMIIFIFFFIYDEILRMVREMREEKKIVIKDKIFNVKINNLMNCMNYIHFGSLPTIGLLQLYTFFLCVQREIKQNFYVFSFRFQSYSSSSQLCNLDFKIVLENGSGRWWWWCASPFHSFYDLSFCFFFFLFILTKKIAAEVVEEDVVYKKEIWKRGTKEHKIWSHW